ncbi:AMP-binding protein [Delftia acidovorans]|uniref:AMP-binding protein n=1 Tax=Delftia acidovorans TaxID=80866 RepID=A0A7T2S3W7_DELAC|nr:AMP-binding protein [Delftia acidovorans]QPS08408.1 AMP-binding protein [Delftia acidovorans]
MTGRYIEISCSKPILKERPWTAWTMYHWLVSGLASKAAVVLYEGVAIVKRPQGDDPGNLWRMAQQAGITHFGTSPRYLAALAAADYAPGHRHDLGALRSVLSAGAPVQPGQFDWLYRAVKKEMLFASISGGTEIMGRLVLGSPLHPVRRRPCAAPWSSTGVPTPRSRPAFPRRTFLHGAGAFRFWRASS